MFGNVEVTWRGWILMVRCGIFYSPILNASQIPESPPTAESMIDENENIPAPHSDGIALPIYEPIVRNIQIRVFLLIMAL